MGQREGWLLASCFVVRHLLLLVLVLLFLNEGEVDNNKVTTRQQLGRRTGEMKRRLVLIFFILFLF